MAQVQEGVSSTGKRMHYSVGALIEKKENSFEMAKKSISRAQSF